MILMFWFFVFLTFFGLGVIIYYYLIASGRIVVKRGLLDILKIFKISKQINPKKNIIFLLGPPCCGKGTLCERLSRDPSLEIISPGNFIRRAIEKDNSDSSVLHECLSQGKLIPDDIVMEILKEDIDSKLRGNSKAIVFDGMPRNVAQAKSLWKLLSAHSLKLILLDCPEEDLFLRVGKRLVCSNKKCQKTYSKMLDGLDIESSCRACDSSLIIRLDDNLETLKKRMQIYNNTVQEIKDFFEKLSVEIFTIPADNKTPPALVYVHFIESASKHKW